MQCMLHSKCVAYTFEQGQLHCALHSSTENGKSYRRGKQIGLKKTDFILSLPEISVCSEQRRERRCRHEPKCEDVNCFRKASKFFAA